MEFTLEQCKKISELLKSDIIDVESKHDIAVLFLNTLKNINCSECKYSEIIPSFVYCTENKCSITKLSCADSFLINDRIQNCPYKEYEDESKKIIEQIKLCKRI